MRSPRTNGALERKALGAALLSCCAIALLALDVLVPVPPLGAPAVLKTGLDWREGIGSSVDSLFVLYGIERGNVRTWQVRIPDRPAVRTEQRIAVPRGFVSVRFNHELNRAVRPFWARVVATERIREDIVTMHIVRAGRTVRSMVFVTDPHLRPAE